MPIKYNKDGSRRRCGDPCRIWWSNVDKILKDNWEDCKDWKKRDDLRNRLIAEYFVQRNKHGYKADNDKTVGKIITMNAMIGRLVRIGLITQKKYRQLKKEWEEYVKANTPIPTVNEYVV